jgi:uncharacterized protein YndB with AHSA1/START domain
MKLQFTVFAKIQKPVGVVFDAVYNPKKLSKYFTTKLASAPLKGGTTVTWDFADFPGAFPVDVKKTVRNKRIVLAWKARDGNYNTRVEFKFKRLGSRSTKVEVTESGWRKNPKALAASYMNCFGWTQMICCLKLYVERGINFRKGFFK